ncbi:hypothetical protein K492DRAFT_172082, partial [Lichtheimia hyalospora FSU 10163]
MVVIVKFDPFNQSFHWQHGVLPKAEMDMVQNQWCEKQSALLDGVHQVRRESIPRLSRVLQLYH